MERRNHLYITLPSDGSIQYYPNNSGGEFTNRLHHALDLESGEWEVGLSEIIYPNVAFAIDRGFKPLYIYCGLVQHQAVGNTMEPLLRIVLSKGKRNEVVCESFQNVHYMPARGGQFQDVGVKICDSHGKVITFKGGTVVVVIHLRKANQLLA